MMDALTANAAFTEAFLPRGSGYVGFQGRQGCGTGSLGGCQRKQIEMGYCLLLLCILHELLNLVSCAFSLGCLCAPSDG
jgi:hypothetical protein